MLLPHEGPYGTKLTELVQCSGQLSASAYSRPGHLRLYACSVLGATGTIGACPVRMQGRRRHFCRNLQKVQFSTLSTADFLFCSHAVESETIPRGATNSLWCGLLKTLTGLPRDPSAGRAPAHLSRGRLTDDASTLRLPRRARRGEGRLRARAQRKRRARGRRLGGFDPIGTALLAAAAERPEGAGCARAWLITTNDNLDAVRFYQRRGWDLVALHRDAVTAAQAAEARDPRGRGLRATDQARARVRASLPT